MTERPAGRKRLFPDRPVTVTLLSAAVATPVVSRLADMYGKRRMLLAAMVLMVAGAFTASIGGTFAWALVGRTMEGFAGAVIPVGISILRDALPQKKIAGAVSPMSAGFGIGSALVLPPGRAGLPAATLLRSVGTSTCSAAVATILASLTWDRADDAGSYTVLLPGEGQYVVVASRARWRPVSEVLAVRGPGVPLPGAGEYVLSVIESDAGTTHTRRVLLPAPDTVIDVELGGREPRTGLRI